MQSITGLQWYHQRLFCWYDILVSLLLFALICARSINVQVTMNIANLLPFLEGSTEAHTWSIAIKNRWQRE